MINPVIPPPRGVTRSEELEIIYDCDDVLWNLVEHSCTLVGADYAQVTDFAIVNIPELTEEKREALYQTFVDLETFRGLDFHPAVAELRRPCELGAQVHINSHSCSQEIADFKRQRLQQMVPGLADGDLDLAVIPVGNAAIRKKSIGERVAVFVDDSPYHIARSQAAVNFLPRQPWNETPAAAELMRGKRYYILDDLAEINQAIYDLVTQWATTLG